MDAGGRRLERVFSQDARVDQIAHEEREYRCLRGMSGLMPTAETGERSRIALKTSPEVSPRNGSFPVGNPCQSMRDGCLSHSTTGLAACGDCGRGFCCRS